LAVGKDHFELAGLNDGVGWKVSLSKIGIGYRQAQVAKGHLVGAWIVKLQPATALAAAVGDPREIVSLQFI